MARTNFIVVRGPKRWALKAMGLAALTMPWGVVYILVEDMANLGLIRHEMVHIEQIDRDGPWWFSAKYLWWLARYGYRANPYEVEAYRREPIND